MKILKKGKIPTKRELCYYKQICNCCGTEFVVDENEIWDHAEFISLDIRGFVNCPVCNAHGTVYKTMRCDKNGNLCK